MPAMRRLVGITFTAFRAPSVFGLGAGRVKAKNIVVCTNLYETVHTDFNRYFNHCPQQITIKSPGFSFFAIQNGGYCMSSDVAGSTYKTYGRSDACEANGLGGRLANQVYQIRGMWILRSRF